MNRTIVRRDSLSMIVLAAPFMALLVVFAYGPVLIAAWQGFGPAAGSLPATPIVDLLSRSDVIASTTRTVAFLFVKIALNVVIGLAFALALWGETPLKRFARSLVLLPTFISIVVLGVVVIFLFDREVGLANLVLSTMGFERQNWLLQSNSAQVILFGFSIWRDQGIVMFIFLAGLSAVPPQVLEAAAVDGAGTVRSFFTITLPLMIRSTGFAMIFSLYAGAQFIAPILQITKGGPQASTSVIPYLIYQEAFEYFDYQSASALSLMFIVVVLVMAAAIGWLARPKWSY
ncbi:sugar ABC transporter permease protein (plasmid) [Rhizobium etli bv. mimosae str. Mim1]|nr:sugar ABC transporter permease protein [Rhizobium etli bv. mimosae str. Mim1]